MSNKVSITGNNMAGLDCNNFISDGRYQCQGEVLNSPPWYPGTGYSHFFVDVYHHADSWIVQVAHAVDHIGSFIRHCIGGTWQKWEKIATSTPPQEYDLPLAEGWSGTAKYYKTQENVCVVSLDISKNSELTTGESVGVVPAGFRPAYVKMSPASTFAPSGSTTIGVSTGGSILLGDVSGQEQARNVYATIAFIAN